MGSFPQPQHFFAAAQENKDFGALHRGPSMPKEYKLFIDTENSGLEASGFEGSKFLHKGLEGSWTPLTWTFPNYHYFSEGSRTPLDGPSTYIV